MGSKTYTFPQGGSIGTFVTAGGVADDTGILCIIWYNNRRGDASVFTVQVTTTTIIFIGTGDSSLPDDATTTAGTLTYSVATVNTFGGLADIINASDHWRCTLVGAIRATPTGSSTVAIGATSAPSSTPLPVLQDMSAANLIVACIGAEADTNYTEAEPRVALSLPGPGPFNPTGTNQVRPITDWESRLDYFRNLGGESSPGVGATVSIYAAKQDSERLLASYVDLGDDTVTERTANQLQNMRTNPGERLVIQSSIAATADAHGLSWRGAYGPPGSTVN